MSKLKIIYFLGRGRSGSTFAENYLANELNSVCLGESRLWPKCYKSKHICSCGEGKTSCTFWKQIIETLPEKNDIEESFKFTMSRKSLFILFMPVKLIDKLYPRLRRDIGTFYKHIAITHGRNLLIDSSKNPAFGFLLSTTNEIEVELCHLVRHPLGVAYSWKRQRGNNSKATLHKVKKSLFKSSIEWSGSNLLSELCKLRSKGNHSNLRYEKLGETEELISIIKNLETSDKQSEIHAMSGNPGKSVRSREFTEDSEWRQGLTLPEKILCTIFTYPVYLIYKR